MPRQVYRDWTRNAVEGEQCFVLDMKYRIED